MSARFLKNKGRQNIPQPNNEIRKVANLQKINTEEYSKSSKDYLLFSQRLENLLKQINEYENTHFNT